MRDFTKILNFLSSSVEMYPKYIFQQLHDDFTLQFISRIIENSRKNVGEAVVIFLSSIKYLFNNKDAFSILEETDSFKEFVEDNSEAILKLSIEKNIQGNLPWRALPILEVFGCMLNEAPTGVIELGASYGLLGRFLLNAGKILENKDRYLSSAQQMPRNPKVISHYLGVELDPPDQAWVLASSIWKKDEESRFLNLVKDFECDNRFQLVKGGAFGFSELDEVLKFTASHKSIVVVTSFMLYQYDKKEREELQREILKFTVRDGYHWLNQDVEITADSQVNDYYLAWNGEKIIDLLDDTCLNWSWMNE